MINQRWAIVSANGFINHGYMKFRRRDVIEGVIADYRAYRAMAKYTGLSDAQFWRVLKRKRGFAVRRVVIKVAR